MRRQRERGKVGVDARITIGGTAYQVVLDMAGATVVLLWGLFADELYVEFDAEKFGPYNPLSGPIPLHRYRSFKRGKADERTDRNRVLADQLDLPISALAGSDMHLAPPAAAMTLRHLQLIRAGFGVECEHGRFEMRAATSIPMVFLLASMRKRIETKKEFIQRDFAVHVFFGPRKCLWRGQVSRKPHIRKCGLYCCSTSPNFCVARQISNDVDVTVAVYADHC